MCDYCYTLTWIWEGNGVFGQFFGFLDLYHITCEFGLLFSVFVISHRSIVAIDVSRSNPVIGAKTDIQLLFYLRLAPTMLPATANRPSTRVIHWILVVISVGLMVAGTGWAFIPGSGHGGLDDGR